MSGSQVLGDWGGSRLRLWLLEDGAIVDRRDGPGIFAAGDACSALLEALGDWPGDHVMLCGMAGAREGLQAVPYLPCPVSVDDWAGSAAELSLHGRRVTIAAGLTCRTLQGRPDVIRGEETQVFGAMAIDSELATGTHWLLLPGTHSKWIRIADGRISGFRTFMTGELFALLQQSSLLAQSAGGAAEADSFSAGLDRASDDPALASSLFEARSGQLVDGKSGSWARGFVSGFLIGSEVAAMAPGETVSVIGEADLAARYAEALAQAGVEARLLDAEACTIAGLGLLDDD